MIAVPYRMPSDEQLQALTVEELQDAALWLARSSRGREAMRAFLQWINEHGLGLDIHNQDAVYTLLEGAWNGYAGTARDAMAEALKGDPA